MTLNLQLGESKKKSYFTIWGKTKKSSTSSTRLAFLLEMSICRCRKDENTEAKKVKVVVLLFYFSVFTFSQVHRKKLTGVLKCAKRVFYPSRVVSSCRGWCEAFSVWVVSRYKEVGLFHFLTQQTASRRPACQSHVLGRYDSASYDLTKCDSIRVRLINYARANQEIQVISTLTCQASVQEIEY